MLSARWKQSPMLLISYSHDLKPRFALHLQARNLNGFKPELCSIFRIELYARQLSISIKMSDRVGSDLLRFVSGSIAEVYIQRIGVFVVPNPHAIDTLPFATLYPLQTLLAFQGTCDPKTWCVQFRDPLTKHLAATALLQVRSASA